MAHTKEYKNFEEAVADLKGKPGVRIRRHPSGIYLHSKLAKVLVTQFGVLYRDREGNGKQRKAEE